MARGTPACTWKKLDKAYSSHPIVFRACKYCTTRLTGEGSQYVAHESMARPKTNPTTDAAQKQPRLSGDVDVLPPHILVTRRIVNERRISVQPNLSVLTLERIHNLADAFGLCPGGLFAQLSTQRLHFCSSTVVELDMDIFP